MSVNFWQTYDFRLDPWALEYEAPVNAGEESSAIAVDTQVEDVAWQPLKPEGRSLPEQLLFVDGRRRLDARFLGTDGNDILYGAFATVAVGAVLVDRTLGRATCMAPRILRILAVGGTVPLFPTAIPCPLNGTMPLTYDICLTSEEKTPQAPLNLVQQAMLKEEAKLASEFSAASAETLVVRDGPLLYEPYRAPEYAVGYVKTLQTRYLSGESGGILTALQLGERTPLFLLGESGSPRQRWSWYLRSGHPNISAHNLGYHHLHGILRLELYSQVPLQKAREIADWTAVLIPEYASHPVRDPRAPQNLTPVGALEKELGRHMGDAKLIERRLRSFLASQVVAP